MAYYVEFPTEVEGQTVLVEVEETEPDDEGIEKAGLKIRRRGRNTVATAHERFDVAVKRVVNENVKALTDALAQLAKTPDEVELKFGIRATGEAGNLAIGKVGASANFEVKLSWKEPDRFAGSVRVKQDTP